MDTKLKAIQSIVGEKEIRLRGIELVHSWYLNATINGEDQIAEMWKRVLDDAIEGYKKVA